MACKCERAYAQAADRQTDSRTGGQAAKRTDGRTTTMAPMGALFLSQTCCANTIKSNVIVVVLLRVVCCIGEGSRARRAPARVRHGHLLSLRLAGWLLVERPTSRRATDVNLVCRPLIGRFLAYPKLESDLANNCARACERQVGSEAPRAQLRTQRSAN